MAGLPEGRVFNFSAGPCIMPYEVLQQAQKELTNFRGSGMSIMEMSHRSKEFMAVSAHAHNMIREVLDVPQNYKIILLQGGATTQFAAVPLNMLGTPQAKCDYLVTGQWGDKAAKEAGKYAASVNRACDTKATKYTVIPDQSEWQLDPEAAFCHYCANETVNGVEWKTTPKTAVPLVGDHSSNFLSKPIDVESHAVVYAGAQKNAGIAGVTVVIAREDYMGVKELPICPTGMSWKQFAAADSMYNTPPCWAMYMMSLYLDYTKSKGGVKYWDEISDKKSSAVYSVVDNSDGFYTCPVDKSCRSRMNLPFQIKGGDEALEKKFLEEAKKKKLYTLAGHRTVGGIRASLYNGMPVEGVDALVNFMKDFATDNAA
jgi:phosphoserine aminotransferase